MTFDDFNLSKTGDGLLPVIIQDATTLKVLMLGYMDRAAFEKTVAEVKRELAGMGIPVRL